MLIMPRKAIAQAPGVSAAIERILLYSESTDVSIFKLSREAGVSQSALARFISHERKTVTRTARKVLDHVNKQHKWHNRHRDVIIPETPDGGYQLIENAVTSIWDGNRHTAELLAALIKALKPVLALAAEIDLSDARGRKP